jgi:hypothetical protein
MANINSPENIKQMQENRDLAATYSLENILNIDETLVVLENITKLYANN